MNPKRYPLPLTLILIALFATSCWQPDLQRYGNSPYCLGAFDDGKFSRGYHFPVQAKYAKMILFWHEASNAFILKDANAILHLSTTSQSGAVFM
jgi:hypothetical protein